MYNIFTHNTIELVLKTTSIKRPPVHHDYSQVRPSNIWWYLHCIEQPPVLRDQLPLFNSPKYLVHSYITTAI